MKSYVWFVSFVLSVATNIITLIYLGMSFKSTNILDVNDWKRKWILVFAYLRVIDEFLLLVSLFSVSIVYSSIFRQFDNKFLYSSILLVISCICIFNIVTSILTIVYLGPSFEKSSIEENDWKRKWIIFYVWFSLILQGSVVVNYRYVKLI